MAKRKIDKLTIAVVRSKEIFDYYNLFMEGADEEELRKAHNRLKLRVKKLKEKYD